VRIIAGKFRRRQLLTNPGTTTRPITDRVKETLFERLSAHVEERRVADVFAGTGTLGLEALSRGARSVVFVENDRKAVDLLQQNVAKLGVQDQTLCWRADVFRCSFHPKGVPDLLPYELIFFDPPYRLVRDLKPGSPLYRALERLARPAVSSEHALLVLRTPEQADFELPPCWRAERRFEISTMELHLYQLDRAEGGTTVSETGLGPRDRGPVCRPSRNHVRERGP
jgi:16S rRNA (guanine966-N2)-methyltransferase